MPPSFSPCLSSQGPPAPAQAQPVGIVDDQDYDADDDGLIEVSSLAQLNAIRWDLDGDGLVDDGSHSDDYDAAFPAALTGMGCPSAGCGGYELTADLDFDTDDWNSGEGWIPIGFGAGAGSAQGGGWMGAGVSSTQKEAHVFEAVFDGNGHTISNMYIDLYTNWSIRIFSSIGLFHTTSVDAVIRNVGLESVDVSPIGNARETGQISVGGLVGFNRGTISNVYVTGSVKSNGATSGTGGLVGNNYGTIIASYAEASVEAGTGETGGLVGVNNGDILVSYATGDVSTGGITAGGLVGNHSGGTYTASSFDPLHSRGVIIASYATGNVSGHRIVGTVGGLAGSAAGFVIASYSLGRVSGTPWVADDERRVVGGLVGGCGYSCRHGSMRSVGWRTTVDVGVNSYWNTQTSGQDVSPYGIGKVTADLQTPTGYSGIYATWNVDVDRDGSPDDPWDFGTGDQYPVLKYGGLRAANQRDGDDNGNDTAGVTVTAANPLAVAEGGSNTYTVVLDTEPTHNVTITPASGDGGAATVSPASQTFTPANWSTAQSFTVSGVSDDDAEDESVRVSHRATSDDAKYDGLAVGSVTVAVTDNDTAGVTVTAANPLAVAEGGSNTYTVVLDSQPTHAVTITSASGDDGAAAVSPASQTFTSANWSTAQSFTVSGVSDDDAEDESVRVSHRATSDDAKYDGLAVGSVAVAVTDDDTPQPEDTPQTGDSDAGGAPEEQKGKNPSLELTGTTGPDTLEGGDGNDLLIGKKGNDVLRGGRGKDELRGGQGDDDLHGGRGADTLFGGQGDDELTGGRGADRLLGGDGDDTYTGGPGADRFVFVAGETGEKIITDFGAGDDMIVLRGAAWPALADIVASGVEQDGGYMVYTLADGLTVETDTPLWAEDFVVK